MHREGHIGMALLFYAPVGLITATITTLEFAALGVIVPVGLAMLPDIDMKLPGVKHRGITHTVHFAALVGLLLGMIGIGLGWSAGLLPALMLGLFGFSTGSMTTLSHIVADALTPAGVDMFHTGDSVSYDIARAQNPIANYGLLVLGATGCLIAAALVDAIGLG